MEYNIMGKNDRSPERIGEIWSRNTAAGYAPKIIKRFINAKQGQCTIPHGVTNEQAEQMLNKGIRELQAIQSLKHQDIYDMVAPHMQTKYDWPTKD